MNYEQQLDAFYSNLDYNPISIISKSIYETILHVGHCANRFDDLSIANSRLASLSGGISIKQLQSGRNELINKNYILYKKGRQPEYCSKVFCYKTYVKQICQNRTAGRYAGR